MYAYIYLYKYTLYNGNSYGIILAEELHFTSI